MCLFVCVCVCVCVCGRVLARLRQVQTSVSARKGGLEVDVGTTYIAGDGQSARRKDDGEGKIRVLRVCCS